MLYSWDGKMYWQQVCVLLMASSVCIQSYRGCIPLSWLAFPMVKAQGDQWRQGSTCTAWSLTKNLCVSSEDRPGISRDTLQRKGSPHPPPPSQLWKPLLSCCGINTTDSFSLPLVWLVVGLINFLQQKDPMISPNMTFIGLACGMILAESHSLLGLINPGDQISDTWGAAVATDHLWDGTIRARCGVMSQTHTLLLRSIPKLH